MYTNVILKNRSFITASIDNIAEAIGYDVDDVLFYIAQASSITSRPTAAHAGRPISVPMQLALI